MLAAAAYYHCSTVLTDVKQHYVLISGIYGTFCGTLVQLTPCTGMKRIKCMLVGLGNLVTLDNTRDDMTHENPPHVFVYHTCNTCKPTTRVDTTHMQHTWWTATCGKSGVTPRVLLCVLNQHACFRV